MGNSQPLRRSAGGKRPLLPCVGQSRKVGRHINLFSPQRVPAFPGRPDTLSLPLADVLPLRLRHIAEKLQHDV